MNGSSTIQKREFSAKLEGGEEFSTTVTRSASDPKVTREEFEALLDQMKSELRKIDNAVEKLKAQQPGNESKEHLADIQRSATILQATVHCQLPFCGPEEQ